MSNQININSTVVVSVGAYGAQTGDDMVLMGVESGHYFGVNTVGSKIWNEIQKPINVSDLITELMGRYEVERRACEEHTLKFLNGLLERELITISN